MGKYTFNLALVMLLAGIFVFATAASQATGRLSTDDYVADTITPEASAESLAAALDIASADLVSAALGTSDPRGVGVVAGGLSLFPRQDETFIVLATGLAESADDPDTNNDENLGDGDATDDVSFVLDGLSNSQGEDLVQLTLALTPPAGKTSLSFDFAFYSEEFPDFIGDVFNDAFIAELGAEPFTSTIIVVGDDVSAPENIAFDPNGDVISVNAAYGFDPASPNPDTGTTYDGTSGLLRATGCLPEELPTGNVVLVLSVTDLGDSILDSAVLLDNFQWGNPLQCNPGAQQLVIDLTPPTAANPVGTLHTVTATVLDDLGNPLPDQVVRFTVNGANTAAGQAETDAQGQATFSYTGGNVGQDTITAWVDLDGNSTPDPDEPTTAASVVWEGTTAISLVSFTAAGQDGQVLLTWETASELESEGFILWRGTTLRGDFARLNPILIPARGDETTGHTYFYLDSDVTGGVTYHYKLEDVDIHGVSDLHGPTSAMSPVKLYLPFVKKR